ncbi:aspartate kinase [Salinibacillus kushneri]|uniref:Aspartokinase n=1 Tax=Salinibacillus kushneri TaxID=237682 RepID=A0A1I0E4M9_9BACI|nr:aspartate kinase [Salinibacillus kushneri]SET39946.1 aspartate kinase [Salinibacillus kushneri]
MKLVVQKFGGTSVRSKDTRKSAISHIKKAMDEGYKVVVVVSAIGRQGDPYATDTLLSLVNDIHSYISNREKDLLVSCGETISSIVFSNELNEQNIKATALTGAQAGFLTNSDFTNAKIEKVKTARILKELETQDVVVVAGFQGKDEHDEITTIGRGGSDTTAAALGAALKSDYVDIFTDVEGIMTADPRIVEEARPLSVVTYNEINNLAHQGAKVIHPRAVELAMQAEIPLRIRSTYSEDEGTLVTSSRTEANGQDIPDRLITGIAHLSNITQITVKSEANIDKLHKDVFTTMAEANISVDFINISPDGVTYTVPSTSADQAVQLLEDLGYKPATVPNCAKVSTVGAGMTGVPGVTSKIVSSLTSKGIQILQSADSHTTIWVLIREDDLKKAVTALHDTFQLG